MFKFKILTIFILISILGIIQSSAYLNESLSAYYSFDGSNLIDLTGKHTAGTGNNLTYASGPRGQYLRCDSTKNTYANLTYFNITRNNSLSFWLAGSNSGFYFDFGKGSSYSGLNLYRDTTPQGFDMYFNTYSAGQKEIIGNYLPSGWTHYIITTSDNYGADENATFNMYKNGVLVYSNDVGTAGCYDGMSYIGCGLNENDTTLFLCARQDKSNYNDIGTIDEFAMWNRILTSTERSLLYNNGYGYNPFIGLTINTISAPTNSFLGQISYFELNATFDSETTTDLVSTLYINGTAYSSSLVLSSNLLRAYNSINLDSYGNGNLTYYFKIDYKLNGIQNTTNSSFYNITVRNLVNNDFDNCSINTQRIINLSMADEDSRTNITGYYEVNFNILNSVLNTIFTVNRTYNSSNAVICMNASLINTTFYGNLKVKYNSVNRVTEEYNQERIYINKSFLPYNITLYDLLSTNSDEFKLTFKDINYLPISGAIVEVWREYIPLGIFLLVEAPKTDTYGNTIVHLVTSTENYNIYAKINNNTVASLINAKAYCSSTTTCTYTILSSSDGGSNVDFLTSYGVSWNKFYNTSTKILTLSFSSVNTLSNLINITGQVNNNYVCSNSLNATGGTITCTVQSIYYNDTIIFKGYVNNNLIFTDSQKVTIETIPKDTIRYIMAIVLILVITLMGLTSGPLLILLLIVSLVGASGLYLIDSGGFLGASSLVLIIIALVIVLFKMTRSKQ